MDKEIFNKAKTIYDTCMDENTINKQGKQPLINLLNQIDLYNNKSKYEGADGIALLIADLHKYNVNFLFWNTASFNDYINPTIIHFMISQPNLLLRKDKYNDENIVSQYKTTILETLNRLFKDQKNEKNFEKIANKITELEKKLSEFFISSYVINVK